MCAGIHSRALPSNRQRGSLTTGSASGTSMMRPLPRTVWPPALMLHIEQHECGGGRETFGYMWRHTFWSLGWQGDDPFSGAT